MLGLVCEPERRYEFASVLQDASTGTTRAFLATAMRVVAELALSIKNIKQHIALCRLCASYIWLTPLLDAHEVQQPCWLLSSHHRSRSH